MLSWFRFLRTASPRPLNDAYRILVAAGEKGWSHIFRATFDQNPAGNVTRQIGVYWEANGVPPAILRRFSTAMESEEQKRARNETWALIHAANKIEAEARVRRRYEPERDRLARLFSRLAEHTTDPSKALTSVALLRVHFIEDDDFPGHRFPWAAAPEDQKRELKILVDWWNKNAATFHAE
jgi:hypothetical protein